MGRGIVEPIDDFRDSNPPSNAELLDALASDFVSNGFDRRRILKTILNSQTYQRSSKSIPENEEDELYFSTYPRRLLNAEQLLDAICDVTGVPEGFSKLPVGTRATQLPSPDFSQSFLKVFGQPARKSVCNCERSSDLNLSQTLTLLNGSFVQKKVASGSSRPRKLLQSGKQLAEIVEECYLAAYSRRPTAAEQDVFRQYAEAEGRSPEQAYEDLLWSLVNSNEFLFQH